MRYALILLLMLLTPLAAAGDVPDLVETTRPYEVPSRPEKLHPRIPELLAAAFARPDAETRIEALADIRRHGLKTMAKPVMAVLDDERPLVLTAAVETLHTLDARASVDRLMALLRRADRRTPVERELVRALDRSLSDWGIAKAAMDWAERIADRDAKLTVRLSAAEAIERLAQGTTDDQPAGLSDVLEPLAGVVADRGAPAPLRLAAARAHGAIAKEPPLAVAKAMLNERSVDRLCALHLLRSGTAETTGELYRRAILDRSPAVQAEALGRLIEWARADALPIDLLTRTTDSADPLVRERTAEGLGLHRDEAAVALLFRLIGDAHPAVRVRARGSLESLAATEAAGAPVRASLDRAAAEIAEAISTDPTARWREAEQVARLAAAIDHKPTAARLLDFFAAERTVVATATWDAIRRLNVAETRDPAVGRLKELLTRLERRAAKMSDAEAADPAEYEASRDLWRRVRAAALTMGDWREVQADTPLRSVIPKDYPLPSNIRAAGVWALGRIHEGKPDAALAGKLAGRLRDSRGREPEAISVRVECAVAIGRMPAVGQLDAVRRFDASSSPLQVRAACRWAVQRITGESQPAIDLPTRYQRDAFIVPLD